MRRAVAFLLALTLLGAAGLVITHRTVNAASEAVEMRETVLCGDSSAARGITVRVPVESGGHLFWTTELEAGPDCAAETDFQFFPMSRHYSGERSYSGLYVNLMMNMGASGRFGTEFNFETEYYGGYEDDFYDAYGEILVHVASRTGPGQEHTERVELTDWIDYVPLQFDLDLPGYYYRFDGGEYDVEVGSGNPHAIGTVLAERLRLPLTGSCPLEVSVSRSVDGEIVEWQISGVHEYLDEHGNSLDEPEDGEAAVSVDTWDGLNVTSLSVVTQDACYFALEQWEREKEQGRVDFSALPGGRGVYRLPYEFEGTDSQVINVKIDGLETVLPVEDDEYIELLDTDGERLIMLTKGNGKLYLTQARLPELTDVRKTELTDMVEYREEDRYDGYSRIMRSEGLYCIETLGGRVLLLESVDGGDYELRLDAPAGFAGSDRSVEGLLSDNNRRLGFGENSGLLWDGERLALARWCQEAWDSRAVSGPVLCVYDKTGLIYAGYFDSSLVIPPAEMYGEGIHEAGNLELFWT